MIKSLYIRNYALIDEITIDFSEGFNIITGETGAGKSIILGALSLLLGSRADLKAVNDGERKTVIEAVFTTVGDSDVQAALTAAELDSPDVDELIMRRELHPGGRSRAFINDTPVTLPVLRSVAEILVDIHSQNQNQQLVSEDFQRRILDTLAGNQPLLADYSAAYTAFRAALKEYTDTRDMLRRSREDEDFLSYQYEQLAEMMLMPGERQALEKERDVLSNADDIQREIASALTPLCEGEVNAIDLLDKSADALGRLSHILDDSTTDYDSLADRLRATIIELRDIADTLTQETDRVAADPEHLRQVEQRLSELYTLELKHHVDSTDALIELRDNLKTQLDALDNADALLASLERRAKLAKRDAMTLAAQISERRARAAAAFSEALMERARPLGMPNLRCDIAMSHDKLGPHGSDRVQFLFAFNKNQQLMPVGSTASGGEVSRLMLSIKSIIAEHIKLPTVIFDEVDTGVSGDISLRMGSLMHLMSRYLQVIAITHLPGVAAMGTRHFKVYKEDDDSRTTTRVRTLSAGEREVEIAMMSGGSATDPTALAAARTLLSKSPLI